MSDTHHDHDEHHDHPIRPHVLTLLTLMALTVITWATASFLKAGEPFDTLLALAIAMTKASLVLLIFMHARESTRLIKVIAFSGFFWTFLFFAYLIADVKTRSGESVFEGWQADVRKVYTEEREHHGDGHGGGHGSADHAAEAADSGH